MEEDMNGLKINCLYAYGCNTAIMLGLGNVFKDFLTGKSSDQEEVKKAIRKLDYFPKLSSIAEREKQDVFSKEVAYKYWLRCHTEETLIKILNLRKRVDLSSKAINILLDSTISTGVVLKDKKVKVRSIIFDEKFYFSEDEVEQESIFPLDLKQWDIVSLHLGKIREKISGAQESIILNSAEEALQKANKQMVR